MKKESTFKMKGFSGFGNSPAKQKFDPYKKDNEAYDKARKKSDDLAKKVNKTYLEGGGAYDDTSSKTGKLMTQWKQGLKSLEKQEKDITRKNESFNAYMKKVKSIKQKPSKRGKIKPTPKAKPTTTQKIKKFFGFGNSPVKQDPRKSKVGPVQEMQRQYNIYDRKRGKKVTYADAWKGMGAVERKKHNNDYDTFVKAAKAYNANKNK